MSYDATDAQIESLVQELKKRLGLTKYFAYLGDSDNLASAIVDEPGRKGYVRARVRGDDVPYRVVKSGVLGAYSPYAGSPVILGYDEKGKLAIEKADHDAIVEAKGNPLTLNSGDNRMSAFTQTDGLLPLFCGAVSGTQGTQTNEVYINAYRYSLNDTAYWYEGGLVDLSAYVPGANLHCYAVIFFNVTTYAITVSTSTPISTITPLQETDKQECLDARPGGTMPIAMWRLHDAQTYITDSDKIEDMRPWLAYTIKNNYTAIIPPTINDDVDLGYDVGSVWIDTATGLLYRCLGNTDGDADWRETVNIFTSATFPKSESSMPLWDAANGIWVANTANYDNYERTGFYRLDQCTLDATSFDKSTRTFTLKLAPAQTSFDWYYRQKRFVATGDKTLIIADTEGTHYIYFDENGDLDEIIGGGRATDLIVFGELPLVSILAWDKDNQVATYLADERHGGQMSGATHYHAHRITGTSYEEGLALGNFDLDASPVTDTASQFSCDNGVILDEDLTITILNGFPQTLSTAIEIPVFYKSGAAGYWRREWITDIWQAATAYSLGDRILADNSYWQVTTAGTSGGVEPTWSTAPYPGNTIVADGTVTWTNVGTPRSATKTFVGGNYRPAWNEYTGGVWTQTEVGGNNYVLAHIYATNDVRYPIIAVQGQAAHATFPAAQTASLVEINDITTAGLPFVEFRPIGTIIYQASSSYNNESFARIRNNDGAGYVDFRETGQSPGQAASAHPNLSSLNWNIANHSIITTVEEFAGFDSGGVATTFPESNYLLTDGTRALGGAWDMNSQSLTNVNIDSGTITGITDLAVADGGTGASTFTDGGLLVGAGAAAIEALAVGLTTQLLIGGGAGTNPAWGTDIPTAVTIGTKYIYRADGTDVPLADGGTGASDAATARTNLGLVAGGTGDIWVEKAGDTMTGPLDIIGSASSDLPTYSAEFLLSTGWTSVDWTGDFASGWTHTPGNTTTLLQSKAAVSATKYQIAYTVTGRTAGTFTIYFGGETSGAISATGAWGPTTSNTDSLIITPTSDFDGTIIISIKSITAISSPLFVLKSSGGTARVEMRANSALANTFVGIDSGAYNTTGIGNVANGYQALSANTTGNGNVANGYLALRFNTTGNGNVANGYQALYANTTGNYNVANGYQALSANTTGNYNVALGYLALRLNTTGIGNVALGYQALRLNITGIGNVALGYQAGYNETGSNTLYIANTSTTTPLIYGLFSGAGAGITIYSQNAAGVPLNVQAIAGQTSNLTEWKNSSGTPMLKVQPSGNLEFVANNIVTDTTTGTKIGTATNQKLGFFNATPIVQPSEILDELTALTHTAPGTPDYAIQDLIDSSAGANFGFATKDEGNTVLSVVVNNAARIKALEDALVSLGLLADAD